jgi:excisionase family DNA binding protein
MLPPSPAVLSVRQVATALGVHISTVYRWIEEGELEAVRYGKQRQQGAKKRGGAIRIPESAVAERLRYGSATEPEKEQVA